VELSPTYRSRGSCTEYACDRRGYFTRYEETVHTEDDLLTAPAQDDLYLGSEEDTLRWAMVCTVGEPSGRLFPLTQQAKPRQYPMPLVRRVTAFQEV